MNKAVGIVGWVLAVTLLAGTAFLYRVNQDLNTQLSEQVGLICPTTFRIHPRA